MNTPSIEVAAADGCRLVVHRLREGAEGAAPPVVCMHALAMDGRMWQGVADALDPRAAVHALDCRGHGASDHPPGPYDTRQFAADLLAVVEHLGAARVHLVGCSMGGTVALAFAGRFAERVASLSVIDSTAWYGAEAPAGWEARAQRALGEGLASMIDFQVERWFSPGFVAEQPAAVQEASAVFLRNDVAAYAEACRMLGRADERAHLGAYAGPAAVVVGADDYATPPAMAQDIAARLAGSVLSVLPGVRHYTPIEVPDAVARCVAAAMARADERGRP